MFAQTQELTSDKNAVNEVFTWFANAVQYLGEVLGDMADNIWDRDFWFQPVIAVAVALVVTIWMKDAKLSDYKFVNKLMKAVTFIGAFFLGWNVVNLLWVSPNRPLITGVDFSRAWDFATEDLWAGIILILAALGIILIWNRNTKFQNKNLNIFEKLIISVGFVFGMLFLYNLKLGIDLVT